MSLVAVLSAKESHVNAIWRDLDAQYKYKSRVLVRDGFTCRYCGNRSYLAQAMKVLDLHNPGEKHWDTHWGSEPLKSNVATVDHIEPEDEGIRHSR